ncbi:MAG: MauE/DoxX family redox-associated membrane protein [Myxococcota bacterium]|nr:MauE/DoxX family redox-associated membrane protein [Myxococcota bacterium]
MSGTLVRFADHAAHRFLGVPIRIVVGMVFIYASLYKLAEPRDFAISIAMYDMLPLGLVNLMAITLPAVEFVAGATLILGLWTRASMLVVNAMLVMFIIAIAWVVLIRGQADFGCGCFSPAAEEAGKEMAMDTLWRDVWYLLGGAYVMVFDDGAIGIDGLLRRRRRRS